MSAVSMNLLVAFVLLASTGIECKNHRPDRHHLQEIFHWNTLDYEFPAGRKEQALTSGSFIPEKNTIISLAAWRDKMFVSVFRFHEGIASTLNYFSLNDTNQSPLLIPYPSFDANYVNEDRNNRTVNLPNAASVINAGHLEIDKCNRMWVIDSGYSDQWGAKRVIAPAAILIFDLLTDTLIRRYVLPSEFINPFTILGRLALDLEGDNCDDVHAYVSTMFRSVIVYSFKKNKAWDVEHSFMGSDPHECNFVYEHLNFQWNYGVFALAVSGKQSDGSKRLYFSPLSSTKIYYVSNRVLQDETYTQKKYYSDVHLLGNVGSGGHAADMIYDTEANVLFNTVFGDSTVGCWSSRKPYESIDVVHKNTLDHFYPGALSIDAHRNLWVLSNRLPLNFFGDFLNDAKNIRIFKETVGQAIRGTNCHVKKNNPKNNKR